MEVNSPINIVECTSRDPKTGVVTDHLADVREQRAVEMEEHLNAQGRRTIEDAVSQESLILIFGGKPLIVPVLSHNKNKEWRDAFRAQQLTQIEFSKRQKEKKEKHDSGETVEVTESSTRETEAFLYDDLVELVILYLKIAKMECADKVLDHATDKELEDAYEIIEAVATPLSEARRARRL